MPMQSRPVAFARQGTRIKLIVPDIPLNAETAK
jgi:hypothetical protein